MCTHLRPRKALIPRRLSAVVVASLEALVAALDAVRGFGAVVQAMQEDGVQERVRGIRPACKADPIGSTAATDCKALCTSQHNSRDAQAFRLLGRVTSSNITFEDVSKLAGGIDAVRGLPASMLGFIQPSVTASVAPTPRSRHV